MLNCLNVELMWCFFCLFCLLRRSLCSASAPENVQHSIDKTYCLCQHHSCPTAKLPSAALDQRKKENNGKANTSSPRPSSGAHQAVQNYRSGRARQDPNSTTSHLRLSGPKPNHDAPPQETEFKISSDPEADVVQG